MKLPCSSRDLEREGGRQTTIHVVCTTLTLFYRWLHEAKIDLLARLQKGEFLTFPELHRLVDTAQYRVDDLSEDASTESSKAQVIDPHRVRMRRKVTQSDRRSVGVHGIRGKIHHRPQSAGSSTGQMEYLGGLSTTTGGTGDRSSRFSDSSKIVVLPSRRNAL